MLVRTKLAGPLAALVASVPLLLAGCSSSQPRDINYGTDVGVGYVPPDAPATSVDAQSVDSTNVIDGGVPYDSSVANVVDGGATYDPSIDANDADSANVVDGGATYDSSVDADD